MASRLEWALSKYDWLLYLQQLKVYKITFICPTLGPPAGAGVSAGSHREETSFWAARSAPRISKTTSPFRSMYLGFCLSPTPCPVNHRLPPTGVHHTRFYPITALEPQDNRGSRQGRPESAHFSGKETEAERVERTWSRPPDGQGSWDEAQATGKEEGATC